MPLTLASDDSMAAEQSALTCTVICWLMRRRSFTAVPELRKAKSSWVSSLTVIGGYQEAEVAVPRADAVAHWEQAGLYLASQVDHQAHGHQEQVAQAVAGVVAYR